MSNLTANNASLNWSKPDTDGGSPITHYIVEMKESSDIRWRVVESQAKELTYQVSNLKEGGAYEFRVTAENKVGPGPPSNPSKTAKYGKSYSSISLNDLFRNHLV